MISLRRIVEQQGSENQYYDLHTDFFSFKQALDNSNENIRTKYQTIIGEKLIGKRIRARSSRGYKQFEKDYEFNVNKITIDDYYDNFVVIAHDTSNPSKPVEYFLQPKYKIQIIGTIPTMQHAMPSAGNEPKSDTSKSPSLDSISRPAKIQEKSNDIHDIYSIESIIEDITPWISPLLKNKKQDLREFVKTLGVFKNLDKNKQIALFILNIPIDTIKIKLTANLINSLLSKFHKTSTNSKIFYKLIAFADSDKEYYKVKIKKIINNKQ